jgi:hypothetical protein
VCLNPSKIADHGFVDCRKCWQCLERTVDDWVGRNIAESKTAKAAHVVSLTYGRDRSTGGIDHLRSSVLTYSDVQKMLKHLRVDGYPVRYFVTGEYGSTKGRAHWHIILYWQERVPDFKLREECFAWKYWPHGWSYWDKMTPQAIRYACKYILKDSDDPFSQTFGPMPSKKPPLGDAYFKQLAAKHVQAGLAPQDLFYSFSEVRRVPHGTRGKTAKALRASSKPIQFMMRGKTAENYLDHFGELWRERYNDEPPASEVFWEHEDKKLKAYVDSVTLPQFDRRGYVPVPTKAPMGGTTPRWSETGNCHWSDVDGVRLWYSYDTEGDLGWHEKIRPDPVREAQSEARRVAASKSRYLSQSRGE